MKKTANANAIPQPSRQHPRSRAELLEIIDAERAGKQAEPFLDDCSKWPLELVVKTAASLHKDGDDFRFSAVRAIELIAECAELLKSKARENHMTHEEYGAFFSEKYGVPLSKIKNARIKFSDAIKLITSQKVKGRAEADFTELLFVWLGNDRSVEGKAQVANEYGRYEREGLDLSDVEDLHFTYEDLRESGALGKRRRPRKNNLPGRRGGKLDTKAEKLNASNPRRDL